MIDGPCQKDPEVRRVADEAAAAAVDAARLYSWQSAWDEHVRRSVHVEAAHLAPGDTPLRQVFRLLDADGGGTLSLREFREGEAEVLGLPISPRVLEPYFKAARDEWEGLMTWEVFEALCMHEFADMVCVD